MAEKVNIKIKGHEKFVLRDGWLTKGLITLHNGNTKVFLKDNGPDILGVGTNMVKAIRYYLQAFDLVDEKPQKGTYLNDLGEAIAANDAYLEDMFTICTLHSKMASNEAKATSWYIFFNQSELTEFTKEELLGFLKREIFTRYNKEYPDGSIKDDIDVLLNMYSRVDKNTDPEDKMNCQMSELGLIEKNGNIYVRKQPDMKKICIDTILFELSQLLEGQASISIDRIGERLENLFNISWVQVNEMLDILDREEVIRVDRTAGLDVIYPINVPSPQDVVIKHYKG
jgi:hypothetical protein